MCSCEIVGRAVFLGDMGTGLNHGLVEPVLEDTLADIRLVWVKNGRLTIFYPSNFVAPIAQSPTVGRQTWGSRV